MINRLRLVKLLSRILILEREVPPGLAHIDSAVLLRPAPNAIRDRVRLRQIVWQDAKVKGRIKELDEG